MGDQLRVNQLGCLRNFIDMYGEKPEDILVLESVANALDAKAKNIYIMFKLKGEDHFVEFHNDAPGMTEKQFDDYHYISYSTKVKGKGIGFAGVGAKVYLGSPGGSEIITISGTSSKKLASRMYLNGNQIEYETSKKKSLQAFWGQNVKHLNNFKGTLYKVKLTKHNFFYLKNRINDILSFWFTSAISLKMLNIFVNGVKVVPWNTKGKTIEKKFCIKDGKIKCFFYDSDEKIAEENLYIVYSVFGKRIKNSPIDFEPEIIDQKQKKVCCIAETPQLAKYLSTNKEEFSKNEETDNIKKKLKKEFRIFLKESNFLKIENKIDQESITVQKEFIEKLNEILQRPENIFLYPWSNPVLRSVYVPNKNGLVFIEEEDGQQIINGNKKNVGRGAPGVNTLGDEEGTGFVKNDNGDQLGNKEERRSRGISIILGNFPEDSREGWMHPETYAIVYNTGHPVSKFFNKDKSNFNLLRVVIFTLIKDGNEKIHMDAKQTIEKVENIYRDIII